MATVTGGAQKSEAPDNFVEWLDSERIRVSARRRHGQWYAEAEDFAVVAIGDTEDAAVREVAKLTEAYLRSYFEDGLTYRDAWRGGKRRRRVWNIVVGLVARMLAALGAQPPFAEEDRVPLPVAFQTRNA
jgi:hypothetical protein